jgi:hypothetical protein
MQGPVIQSSASGIASNQHQAAKTFSISSETSSSTSTSSPPLKKDWIGKWIQKINQLLQTEENKKMIHIFLLDPILNHIFERLFPYVLILCVLFVVLTIMITLTMLLVFTRLPAALAAVSSS